VRKQRTWLSWCGISCQPIRWYDISNPRFYHGILKANKLSRSGQFVPKERQGQTISCVLPAHFLTKISTCPSLRRRLIPTSCA